MGSKRTPEPASGVPFFHSALALRGAIAVFTAHVPTVSWPGTNCWHRPQRLPLAWLAFAHESAMT
jgi:hypothetical protein